MRNEELTGLDKSVGAGILDRPFSHKKAVVQQHHGFFLYLLQLSVIRH